MGFADKYRRNVADATRLFLDKDSKAKKERKKLDDEEKRKRDEFRQRRKKMDEKDSENEDMMVVTLGNVVMATGFMDAFVNDFELLSGIILHAMDSMEKDASLKDTYLSYALDEFRKKGRKDKEASVSSDAPAGNDVADSVQDVVA